MKHLKILLTALVLSILTFSCSLSDDGGDELPTEAEIDNLKFLNTFILGTWEGVDECVGDTCFGIPIEYDEITFTVDGDFINYRTELVTGGEIKNTFRFIDTNQFIISEKESDGSIYNTYQRITKITETELIFEEYKDSDIGDYSADQIYTYTMRKRG